MIPRWAYYIPALMWTPIFLGTIGVVATAIVVNNLSRNRIGRYLEKDHAEEINKHFGWTELPHDNPRR